MPSDFTDPEGIVSDLADADPTSSRYDAPYVLMGREIGKDVTEFGHLIRSIVDILTTPLGSRVMLRSYGSELFQLIDEPINQSFKIRIFSAVLDTLSRWEPRLLVTRVTIGDDTVEDGALQINLEGVYMLEGRGVVLNNITLDFKKSVEQRTDTSASYVAAASPSSTDNLIGFTADAGERGSVQNATAGLFRSWDARAYLFLGDNTYYTPQTSQAVRDDWAAFDFARQASKAHFVLGNHDLDSNGSGSYTLALFPHINRRYYWKEFPDLSLAMFFYNSGYNSAGAVQEVDGNAIGSAQYWWLRNAIAQSRMKWKVLCLHHPPHSNVSTGNDHVKPAMDLKLDGRIDAILAGHTHVNEILKMRGIPIINFSTGSGHALRKRSASNTVYGGSDTSVVWSETAPNKFATPHVGRLTVTDAALTIDAVKVSTGATAFTYQITKRKPR